MKIQVTRELVALAKHVVSTDLTRKSLQTICVNRFDKKLGLAIATDGIFLLRVPVDLLDNEDKSVLIDVSMLTEMSKLMPAGKIDVACGVIETAHFGETLQSLTVGNVVINGREYADDIYPDINQVFPTNKEDFIAINLGIELLEELLKTVRAMGDSKGDVAPGITLYVSDNPKKVMPVVISNTLAKGKVDGLVMPINVDDVDTTFPVGGRKK